MKGFDCLSQLNGSLRLCVKQYADSECIRTVSTPLKSGVSIYKGRIADQEWSMAMAASAAAAGGFDSTLTFQASGGVLSQGAFGLEFCFDRWTKDNYVLMPAAAYNGNRFKSRPLTYPPLVQEVEDIGPDAVHIITDIPRLNIDAGPSQIQQLTKDISTPAIGFYAPGLKKACWLLTPPKTIMGDSGIYITENADRTQAIITIAAPGVRERVRFSQDQGMHCLSSDRGADFSPDDSIELKVRVDVFDCSDLQGLFDRFVKIRKELTGPVQLHHELPFSSAWQILEEKYNQQNWNEQDDHYKVGVLDRINDDWQLGWVGGIISTYPMLAEGGDLSQRRALKTFDFLFSTQTAAGFFPGIYANGKAYGDGFNKPGTDHWHLLRKSADALYFIIKQFELLRSQGRGGWIKPRWEKGTRRLADAFVRLWSKYGQFGQFVDVNTGDILVGGSTSAATACAGLALASRYFQESLYLKMAQLAARSYYQRDVQAGVTTGGPGEIAQCPDSESAFGLLESFMVLYERTQKTDWLTMAEHMAAQCFTWCISYDYDFPCDSSFGKLKMHSAGAVWASVQNKHGAPGICTFSGDALFKLYRATGKDIYLELIQEMAHNITQYLSRYDRPVSMIPHGWMNERVELSDWAEPTGEISPESSWCEVSCMLTWLEIPGIYVQLDTGRLCVFDNVEASIVDLKGDVCVLDIFNPTRFDAQVKVFVETRGDAQKPLEQTVLLDCEKVSVPSLRRVRATVSAARRKDRTETRYIPMS